MDNEKNAKYYLEKIINDIDFCINLIEKKDLDDFCSDEVLSSAISFKFVQISENTNKLPESLCNDNSSIPWQKISGLRNRIVHDYGSIQLDIIYDTIKNDLPELLSKLKDLIK